jgi:hypothetical protein
MCLLNQSEINISVLAQHLFILILFQPVHVLWRLNEDKFYIIPSITVLILCQRQASNLSR